MTPAGSVDDDANADDDAVGVDVALDCGGAPKAYGSTKPPTLRFLRPLL